MLIAEENIVKFRIAGASTGQLRVLAIPDAWFSDTKTLFGSLCACRDPGGFAPDRLDVVVLLAFMDTIPRLCPDLDWYAAVHQAGGIHCDRHRFVCTRIFPEESSYRALRRIARDRHPGGRAGWSHRHNTEEIKTHHPGDVAIYIADLAVLGLTSSGIGLTESIHPLDATQANLDVITCGDMLLQEFSLRDEDDLPDSAARLLIITENSD